MKKVRMGNTVNEWDLVMDAFREGNQMRLKELAEKRGRYQKVFGATGEKSTCEEIQEIFKSGGYIIDVRNPVDYISGGKIHNSINVPIDGLLKWCNANVHINKNTPILVYSNEGNMAASAKIQLERYHYTNVTNIGTHKWYNLCS
jgi:rhodanese-related sulfurtransferase